MLDFDTMLLHVGEFGLYQKILFTFQAPFCIFVTFVLFGQLFMVLYPMNYWCDSHFGCITLDSMATSAQRRNISLAWITNGGIFGSDPCVINEIDKDFLPRLHDWSRQNCETDRTVPCVYSDGSSESVQSSSQRDPATTPSWPNTPRPKLTAGNGGFGTGRWNRKKRHYGTQGSHRDSTLSYFSRTTTTTDSSINFNSREHEEGDYSGSHNSGNQGGQWHGPSGSTGGNYGQGSYKPGNDYGETERYPSGSGSNYGRNPGQHETTTPFSSWTSSESSPVAGPTGGQIGNRPKSRRGGNTNISLGWAGWPEPYCPTKNRTRFVLSNNTIILGERMTRSRTGQTVATCNVSWSRGDVPYRTIVTEGNWWCNAELYTTIAQAVFFLGAIVGGFLIGWIADTFGRVPALVIANILGALGGALSAVSTNVWVFSLFRFITGMAFDNCFTMMYILVLEFCGPSYRTLVANLSIAIFYTLGTLAIPLLAWLISDWQIYALAISLPMLLGLLALFFVPESARWLLSKGRAKEATNILRNFAKVNRRKVDDKIFVDFEQEATKLFAQLEQEEEEPSLAAAFRTPRLRRTFMLLIIFWALIALVYDGHSRNIMNLANDELNVFWMFGIASMTEFPADMLLIFTLDRFGRRWLAFGSMTLSGAFSFIAAAITPNMRTGFLVAAIISRFWVNVAFNIGLQYAAELLPTVIRAQGVNAIHIMGYVASIISPFVAAIGRSNPTLSLILLGAFSITAGFASLFLAETLGEDLPNTLEEAENFGKDQSFFNCPICAKERDEIPIEPPSALEERPVVMRNALRGSIRGETYRSSIISHGSSGGGNRRSRYFRPGDNVAQAPEPTEMTRLRRITH